MTFTFHAFHQKAECCLFDLAGLLAWVSLIAFPSRSIGTVAEVISNGNGKQKVEKGVRPFTILYSPFTTLTATGIAPDLHRISLFIPMFKSGTKPLQM